CRSFLQATIAEMRNLRAIVTLGRISHDSTLATLNQRRSAAPFGHGAAHDIGRLRIFASYHCSRYNTSTGVLTPKMFEAVFAAARAFLGDCIDARSWLRKRGRNRPRLSTTALCAAKPGDHLLGVLVRREYRIEHFGDDAVVDDKRHALEQRHPRGREGRQLDRARELEVLV